LNSNIRLFADDSILYRTINSQEDHLILQQDLLMLQSWADKWKMDFNVSKCAIMSVTHKTRPSVYGYIMKSQEVPRVTSHDYLGVRVTSKLKWSEHCDRVSTNASRSLGLLRRNLYACSQDVKSQAFSAIVQPKLEYASSAWSPHTAKDINRLQAIQNAGARFCMGQYSRHASVTKMVEALYWDTLRIRRMPSSSSKYNMASSGYHFHQLSSHHFHVPAEIATN